MTRKAPKHHLTPAHVFDEAILGALGAVVSGVDGTFPLNGSCPNAWILGDAGGGIHALPSEVAEQQPNYGREEGRQHVAIFRGATTVHIPLSVQAPARCSALKWRRALILR